MKMNNSRISSTPIPVVIRPAHQSDQTGMLEVTKNIWQGHDYVPYVWDEWLAESEGMLCVAETNARMVGLGKLTHLGGNNWWMEGMRVHPEYQGRGIATQIHEYLVNFWLEHGGGAVRLTTADNRYPIHHLCQRGGFTKISERKFLAAPTLQNNPAQTLPFQLVTQTELPTALDFLRMSPMLTFSNRLVDLGWRHASLRMEFLQHNLDQGRLYWWREQQGLLGFWEEEDDDKVMPCLSFLGCKVEDAPALLMDYRRLAGSLGYSKAAWMAPLHPDLQPMLDMTGFSPQWDETLFLYARDHPEKSQPDTPQL